ncbi:Trypsin [compost metagenome]
MKVFFLFMIMVFSNYAQALSNGVPAVGDEMRAVVFLQIDDQEDDGSLVSGFCNGTLVAKNVIVTAAHCVKNNSALGFNKMDVEVGVYKYVNRPDGEIRRIGYARFYKQSHSVKSFFMPGLKKKIDARGVKAQVGPVDDIAVVVLDKEVPLPENFWFPKVISQKELAGISHKILQYDPTIVSNNPFEEISNLDTKRQAKLNSLSKTFSGYWESKSISRVAPGDSGAPLFLRIGNEWRLAGITKGRAENLFSNWDVFGILDAKICAISEQIMQPEIRAYLCKAW